MRQEHGAALPEPHERSGARLPVRGHVHFRGKDIYPPSVDPVAVRRYIGMVFQQPNPFATSIFNNVAFGLRLNNFKGDKTREGRTGVEARGPVG